MTIPKSVSRRKQHVTMIPIASGRLRSESKIQIYQSLAQVGRKKKVKLFRPILFLLSKRIYKVPKHINQLYNDSFISILTVNAIIIFL